MSIPEPGTMAPDVTLMLDDGRSLTLAQLRGGPVVLYFYPEDDSGGCVDENVEFSGLAADFAARGATLIGVSPDPVDSHNKIPRQIRARRAAGGRPGAQGHRGVWLWQLKKLYGREFMGVIRASALIGADGRMVRMVRATRIKGHAAKMLEALDAHLASA